jgi:uncharacterized delta-60 repeat protein
MNGLFRLNTDGSNDDSFHFGLPRNSVRKVICLAGGSILINCFYYLYRLTPDGAVDTTFQVPEFLFGGCYDMAVQSDGKIIVGGAFRRINSIDQIALARLNSDGSFDFSFRPSGTVVLTLRIQSDGSIVTGVIRSLSRYFSNGAFDGQFSRTINDPNLSGVQLAVAPDDRVYFNSSTSVFQISGRNRLRVPPADIPITLEQSSAVSGPWSTVQSIPANSNLDYLLPNDISSGNALFRVRPAQ